MHRVKVGDKFNKLEVIEETEHRNKFGHKMWLCRCECGTVKEIAQYYLTSGSVKSCGCTRDKAKIKKGDHFGQWEVIEEADRNKKGNKMWRCKCSCGNIGIIPQGNLINYTSTSCGCNRQRTMIEKYGEVSPLKIKTPRSEEQIRAIKNKESVVEFIGRTFGDKKPSTKELADALGITNCMMLRYIKEYEIRDYMKHEIGVSAVEEELYEYVSQLIDNKYTIRRNDRELLKGKELDMYIPELKIALEFNGTYWHCSFNVEKDYHLNKSYECAKLGVRLIHIFEYEWRNDKDKIKCYLKQIFGEKKRVYARNTVVEHIEKELANEFLEKYHLQGSERSSIIQYGCFLGNELLGVMTFGNPRFDKNAQYELLRLAWKEDISVIGGAEKIFSTFIKEYAPEEVISYCNLAKFSGGVYSRLGFKVPKDYKINENYVWIQNNTGEVLSRYQTRKSEIVKRGLGTNEETEEEIMLNNNYLRIYDCGNLKYIWSKE